jgi:protein subunit release factor A
MNVPALSQIRMSALIVATAPERMSRATVRAIAAILMTTKTESENRPEGAVSSLIKPEDLKIEAWPPRQSPGGQHVGTGPSGVKVTHLPSGIEACVEIGRSQHRNRVIAVEMIEAAITHPQFRPS